MEIVRTASPDWEAADARHFSGPARLVRGLPAGDPAAKLFKVEFQPGVRTNWHTHSGPQWLIVLAGRCRVQVWQETARELVPGDAVRVAPGEKHWHGATPDGPMTHLALNLDATTEWLEPVTDAQYGA